MKFVSTHEVIALPRYLRNYGASDYGTMEPQKGKKEPDFTEHGVWSIDSQGRLFARAWWFKQAETDKSVEAFLTLVKRWKPVKWWNEGGLIDKSLAPYIRKEMRRTRTFTVLESLPSMLDKGLKLQAFHSMVANGMVYGPLGEPWWERVIDQLIKFPGGRWDDAADVCGLMGRGIDQMFDAQVPVEQKVPALIPFTESWLEYNDRNAKPKVRYFA
jgi:predicted phage terminase large subunit-like protein